MSAPPHTREPLPASPWVERFISGAPRGGKVLDVACGGGRHLRLALARGYDVVGVDRDLTGVADLERDPRAELLAADLEDGQSFPFHGRTFAGVVVTNYLWRPILPDIVACVASDGVLVYETFAIGNERCGRPSNPDFLLRPGELVDAVGPRLVPIAFEHVTRSGPPRVVQRIAAVGRDHPWLWSPPAG
ncbi:MAG: methyltransferase domain-containing protein [Hyphomicrobiaceae bacterium]|nr:methyltransferase domain-containing protein [Hyphomicrobiaceae bacterium]